jgi:uncharacterized protein YdaL
MLRRCFFLFIFGLAAPVTYADSPARANAEPMARLVSGGPSVLVLYDGPDVSKNPGRLDALFLANLLGHFTTRRTVHPFEDYRRGEWKDYDAVFAIVYQRKYTLPYVFVEDIAKSTRTFCYLANQVAQLDRAGILREHGVAFERFDDRIKMSRVAYKGHTIDKGDPETNFLRITDESLAHTVATVLGPSGMAPYPYIIQSGVFWIVADSPFSYSSEKDRYLVFCDVLHDILKIDHPESHSAMLRIEDINAVSQPRDLQAMLEVIRRQKIPFAFGFVPMYVNPHDRLEYRLADKPAVVRMLKKYVAEGGVPVLHGYTHQYRGVTTDDYEFWDDLGDRPVRGDSEAFAARRVEEAIKESLSLGLYPVTWETPHYAASALDYRIFRRYFNTVFERRLAGSHLDSDQYFPYPVIDIYGQYVVPENLAYVPIDDVRAEPILQSADAATVVRDGYASFFFHPFLKPNFLDEIISGIKQRGFHFVDLRAFPNEVHAPGRIVKTGSGTVEITGHGRYLNELTLGPRGEIVREKTVEVAAQSFLRRSVKLAPGETYVAFRQDVPPPSRFAKLIQVAKGDISILTRKLETVLPPRTVRNPVRTTLLWNPDAEGPEATDQESFHSILSAIGFDVDRIDHKHLSDDDLGTFSLLVIPRATARTLHEDDVSRIVGAVNGGITLITDGESPLSRALGVRLGEPSVVGTLQDHLFVNQDTRWPDRPRVPWISQPTADNADIYYSDRDLMRPLVLSARRGEGRYLYFAPLFDPLSGQGYARFPNLPQILFDELRVQPLVRRTGAEVYFDPGYRQAISIEVLARMWRRYGIRAVHAAAWHFYDKYSYDYARLVKVAHQNGILVYAWFEWPEVSERFWEQHPRWRDKTALLTDAHIDWRYLMNLQNPDCLKAVLEDMRQLLRRYEWDGVNFGELTFESGLGPEKPELFTPFNDVARKEFQSANGIDPIDLFRPDSPHYWKKDSSGLEAFYTYRREVNVKLLETFLQELDRLNRVHQYHWDIVVTVLDALQHPELRDYLAIDMDRTLAVLNRYDATLQVEDAAADWSKPPDRYRRLGKRYATLALKRPFMIDINVLSVHPFNQMGFATSQPTGSELFQLWRYASEQASRVCLYAESTIFEQDWDIMPYAMGAHASVHKEGDNWIVTTPNTVRLEVGRDTRKYRLDGRPWYCAEKGEVLVPPGEHTVTFSRVGRSWFDTSQLDTYLLSISGELVGSERSKRGLQVEYDSPHRCALRFNKMPYKIFLDEKSAKITTIRGDDGYTVLAPPGQHRLRVVSETAGLYALEFTSLVSASLIVLFGLASSGLLAILFLFVTLRRRTARIRRFIQRILPPFPPLWLWRTRRAVVAGWGKVRIRGRRPK